MKRRQFLKLGITVGAIGAIPVSTSVTAPSMKASVIINGELYPIVNNSFAFTEGEPVIITGATGHSARYNGEHVIRSAS